ncbi:hypothetical protein PTKIN_Ptkin04bG0075500 [Pterospermum kingtungense]
MNAKKEFFQGMIEKMSCKLVGWKAGLLSQGGRLTVIKSALSSMPNYILSVFKAPSYVCEKIDQMVRNFWWGHKEDERKIHFRKWDFICQHKDKGGLGIRKTELMNKSLLSKQAWRIISNLEGLLAATLLPKYCND